MSDHNFGNPEVVEEELDILIIGGGMAACGAAFEISRWIENTGLKVKLVPMMTGATESRLTRARRESQRGSD